MYYKKSHFSEGWECRPDLCAIDCKTNPRKFIGKFWVDSLVHDEKALKYVVDVMGQDKVILGTDYPFPRRFCFFGYSNLSKVGEDEPGKLVAESDLSEDAKEKILGLNALEFLGLRKEKFVSNRMDTNS
jgi:aminocarboxymuconate-semialdehyde decarboxylase